MNSEHYIDDSKRYRECVDCNGMGYWVDGPDEDKDDKLDCTSCNGTGYLGDKDTKPGISVFFNSREDRLREKGYYWYDTRNDQDISHGPFDNKDKAVNDARKELS